RLVRERRGRRRVPVEPRRHRRVVELGAVLHQRRIHLALLGDDRSVGGDQRLDHQRRPPPRLEQRRQIERQPLRQHGKRAHAGVHAGGVGARRAIDRRAGAHEVIDVGDPDVQPRAAVRRFGRLDLIEVLRLGVVDRGPRQRAQIAHAVELAVGLARARGLRDRLGRRVCEKAALAHRLLRDARQAGRVVSVHGHGAIVRDYRSCRPNSLAWRRTMAQTSSGESVTCSHDASPGSMVLASTSVSIRNSTSGRQNARPTRIIGKRWILPVWINVSVSKISSSVPNPPGIATKPYEYFTSITLRTKKWRNSTNVSRYGFGFCSTGSVMLQPTDRPPASRAPRLAASMIPGPPPVITVKPARASAPPTARPSS